MALSLTKKNIVISNPQETNVISSDAGFFYNLTSYGNYIYGTTNIGTRMVKFDLENHVEVDSIAGMNGIGTVIDGKYLYQGTAGNIIYKIDLDTFSIVASLATSSGNIRSIVAHNGYLYAGINGHPAKILKIRISDFTEVAAFTFGVGEDDIVAPNSLVIHGDYLYACSYSTAVIKKIDLTSFTEVSSLTPSTDGAFAMAICGDYLYVGIDWFAGSIAKIDLSTFTEIVTTSFTAPNQIRQMLTYKNYIFLVTLEQIVHRLNTDTFTIDLDIPISSFTGISLLQVGNYLYVGASSAISEIQLEETQRLYNLSQNTISLSKR